VVLLLRQAADGRKIADSTPAWPADWAYGAAVRVEQHPLAPLCRGRVSRRAIAAHGRANSTQLYFYNRSNHKPSNSVRTPGQRRADRDPCLFTKPVLKQSSASRLASFSAWVPTFERGPQYRLSDL